MSFESQLYTGHAATYGPKKRLDTSMPESRTVIQQVTNGLVLVVKRTNESKIYQSHEQESEPTK